MNHDEKELDVAWQSIDATMSLVSMDNIHERNVKTIDAIKAYAEHHAHSIIDETDDLKKRIAELEEQRAVFIELVKAQHCK